MKILETTLLFVVLVLWRYSASAQPPSVINVEIDWMVDSTPGNIHSHIPNQAEINAVVQMFACHGITLNVQLSTGVAHVNVLQTDPNDTTNFFGYTGPNSFGAIKNANFNNTGGGWHYCLFAHNYTDSAGRPTGGSSGLAETGAPGQVADDFVVTLGSFSGQVGTAWDRAGTFAHELGHNLGLRHAGNMDASIAGTNTPSVPSIMTYFFQLAGVKANLECQGLTFPGQNLFKNLDYSNGVGCTLDENNLNESFGSGMRSVDWNCNGVVVGTAARDISNASTRAGWCGANGARTILTDYDEWSNIRNYFPATDGSTVAATTISCITAREAEEYTKVTGGCPQPSIANENCVAARMLYVRTGSGSGTGTCSNAFFGFNTAYAAVVNGDILYFAGGTFPTGGQVRLDRPCILVAPSGAIIGQ